MYRARYCYSILSDSRPTVLVNVCVETNIHIVKLFLPCVAYSSIINQSINQSISLIATLRPESRIVTKFQREGPLIQVAFDGHPLTNIVERVSNLLWRDSLRRGFRMPAGRTGSH